MDFLTAIILGTIEGITEFLPISSTGHLILFNQILSFPEPFMTSFDIIIQLGAIIAVVFYFHKRLNPFQKGIELSYKKQIFSIWQKAIIGVIPALILGYLFGDFVEEKLFNPLTVAISLFIGGVILIYIESVTKHSKINSIDDLSIKLVLLIGLIQTVAMVPGVSRSAATIIGAMLFGSSRVVAAEFSFFLAIPTMIAASGYSLLKYGLTFSNNQLLLLATGFIVSFIVAFLVIKVFMNFISKNNFKVFGYYRIVLSIIVLILLFK